MNSSDWLKYQGDFCINRKTVLRLHFYFYDVKLGNNIAFDVFVEVQ